VGAVSAPGSVGVDSVVGVIAVVRVVGGVNPVDEVATGVAVSVVVAVAALVPLVPRITRGGGERRPCRAIERGLTELSPIHLVPLVCRVGPPVGILPVADAACAWIDVVAHSVETIAP